MPACLLHCADAAPPRPAPPRPAPPRPAPPRPAPPRPAPPRPAPPRPAPPRPAPPRPAPPRPAPPRPAPPRPAPPRPAPPRPAPPRPAPPRPAPPRPAPPRPAPPRPAPPRPAPPRPAPAPRRAAPRRPAPPRPAPPRPTPPHPTPPHPTPPLPSSLIPGHCNNGCATMPSSHKYRTPSASPTFAAAGAPSSPVFGPACRSAPPASPGPSTPLQSPSASTPQPACRTQTREQTQTQTQQQQAAAAGAAAAAAPPGSARLSPASWATPTPTPHPTMDSASTGQTQRHQGPAPSPSQHPQASAAPPAAPPGTASCSHPSSQPAATAPAAPTIPAASFPPAAATRQPSFPPAAASVLQPDAAPATGSSGGAREDTAAGTQPRVQQQGGGGGRPPPRARRTKRSTGLASTKQADTFACNLARAWRTHPEAAAPSPGEGAGNSSSSSSSVAQGPVQAAGRAGQQASQQAAGPAAAAAKSARSGQQAPSTTPRQAAAQQPNHKKPQQQPLQQDQQQAAPQPSPLQQHGSRPAAQPRAPPPAQPTSEPPAAPPDPHEPHRAAMRAHAVRLKEQGNSQYAKQEYAEVGLAGPSGPLSPASPRPRPLPLPLSLPLCLPLVPLAALSYSLALTHHAWGRGSGRDAAMLHSNRAGAHLMEGRPKDALDDAVRAMALDPRFFRAVSRTSTCHCRMGNFKAAKLVLDRALDSLSASNPHFQDLSKQLREVEALQTATHQACAALVAAVASGAVAEVEAGLQALAKLHPQVAYSEAVAAAKACALLAVGKPREALMACVLGYTAPSILAAAPWRLWLLTQAQYQLGDMQAALNWANQLANIVQQVGSPSWQSEYEQEAEAFGGNSVQALAGAGLQLPSREEVGCVVSHLTALSALKEEGNAAVKDGNLKLAVDKYSAALALLPPPGYAAVLHCNRAAAHQGLDSLVDALADCGRAKALDPGYARASTRQASVLLGLRQAGSAAEVLKAALKAGGGVVMSAAERQTATREAAAARTTAVWQTAADHYLMLGLERDCTDEEVRKAYRRSALKHHPDKAVAACRFGTGLPVALPRSQGGLPVSVVVLGAVQAVEGRVRQEASWLFNLITQASDGLATQPQRDRLDRRLDSQSVAPGPSRPAFHRPFPRTSSSSFYSYSSYGYGRPSRGERDTGWDQRDGDGSDSSYATYASDASDNSPC
ncbi:hypothetical protein V8C86DRAFT_3140345 [Haematococcus lacustris]